MSRLAKGIISAKRLQAKILFSDAYDVLSFPFAKVQKISELCKYFRNFLSSFFKEFWREFVILCYFFRAIAVYLEKIRTFSLCEKLLPFSDLKVQSVAFSL